MNSRNVDIVKDVIAEVFGCNPASIKDEMGPGDIPQWDSLGHIILLEALSERTGTELPLEQAIEARSILRLAKMLSCA